MLIFCVYLGLTSLKRVIGHITTSAIAMLEKTSVLYEQRQVIHTLSRTTDILQARRKALIYANEHWSAAEAYTCACAVTGGQQVK